MQVREGPPMMDLEAQPTRALEGPVTKVSEDPDMMELAAQCTMESAVHCIGA